MCRALILSEDAAVAYASQPGVSRDSKLIREWFPPRDIMFGDIILILASVLVFMGLLWRTSIQWSIPATVVAEGTAKAFERNGEFRKLELTWRGHRWRVDHPDPGIFDDWWIDEGPAPDRDSLRELLGGFYWVGIPFVDRIATRNQRWIAGRRAGEGPNRGEILLEKIEKTVDHIALLDDIYYEPMASCETTDRFAVKIVIGVTMSVGNPRRAWYSVENWAEATIEQLREPIRLFVGARTFDELRRTGTASERLLADEALERRVRFVKDNYGVLIKLIQIAEVSPADEEVRRALHQKYIGEQAAARREAEAIGEARAIAVVGNAHAEAIRKRNEARQHDPTGVFATAEAIQASKPSTLVIGAGAVTAIPTPTCKDETAKK